MFQVMACREAIMSAYVDLLLIGNIIEISLEIQIFYLKKM